MQNRESRVEIVRKVLIRDGENCALPGCGEPLDGDITIDHWIPLSRGGTWDLKNLKLMHQRCNRIKGNIMPEPDGTLVLTSKDHVARVVVIKPEVCGACNSGRDLGPEEECIICGSGPQPKWQQWAKLPPSECPHEGPWHCYSCHLGLVPRNIMIESS